MCGVGEVGVILLLRMLSGFFTECKHIGSSGISVISEPSKYTIADNFMK